MERDKDVFVDVLRMKEAIRVESLSILPVFLLAPKNIGRINQSRLSERKEKIYSHWMGRHV